MTGFRPDPLMRMNHDQWPPGDPPGLEEFMDPPAWVLVVLLVMLAIPILVAVIVSETWKALTGSWRH